MAKWENGNPDGSKLKSLGKGYNTGVSLVEISSMLREFYHIIIMKY